MSIAEKLTTVAENQPKVYDAGYNRGRKNFGAIGAATGETITLKDTSPVEHIMDVEVRGKNIIPYPFTSGTNTRGGIKLTDNNDGSLTIDGTLTAAIEYSIRTNHLLKKGTYTFSIYLENSGDITGISFYVRDKKAAKTICYINGSAELTQSKTFTINEDIEEALIYLTINSPNVGKTYSATVKPMLEEGKTATTYAPYIEDISTVKLNTLGKNQIDVFGRTKGTLQGYDASNKRTFELDKYYVGFSANNYYSPNGITAELTETGEWQITSSQAAYGIGFPFKVCPNTKYIGSANRSGGYFSITFYDEEGVYIKHVTAYSSFTVPDNCYIALLIIAPETKNTTVTYSNIQIELGTQKSEYEPYKEPVEYAINEDGAVDNVLSIYPNMTLNTDTVGAVIDVEYSKDIDKVCAEIELSAIKSTSLWRAIQRPSANGDFSAARTNCSYMFYMFDTKYLYPQYNIEPKLADYFARDMSGEPIDLVKRLAECGVTMNFSNCTSAYYLFYNSMFSHLPELDLRNVRSASMSLLFGKNVVTIDKLIVSANQNISQTFGYAYHLQNIVIEGTIGAVGNLDLKYCNVLTLDSLKSMLLCLEDVSGTDKEQQYSVILTDRLQELLVADGATAPNGTTWIEYVDAKGWLI